MEILVLTLTAMMACLVGSMYFSPSFVPRQPEPQYRRPPSPEEIRAEKAKPMLHLSIPELRIMDHAFRETDLAGSRHHEAIHAARHIKVMEQRHDALALRACREDVREALSELDLQSFSKQKLERLLASLR